MKNFFWIFFILVFFLSVQKTIALENNSSESAAPLSTVIEYQLPYPGLLPDHPLYFLKTTRDKIVGFLIADPLKKAEFNLLESDKRINAAFYLFKKHPRKEALIISTISKGENYFEEAIGKTKEAKKQGIRPEDLLGRLLLSNQKHQEVLKEMENKSSKENKENFIFLEKRLIGFEKEVNSLILK